MSLRNACDTMRACSPMKLSPMSPLTPAPVLPRNYMRNATRMSTLMRGQDPLQVSGNQQSCSPAIAKCAGP